MKSTVPFLAFLNQNSSYEKNPALSTTVVFALTFIAMLKGKEVL